MLQKIAGALVRPMFCGGPVRPNMLNIPKSASDLKTIVLLSISPCMSEHCNFLSVAACSDFVSLAFSDI